MHVGRTPQFFTLTGLLEQSEFADHHAVRFHEGPNWSAGIMHLGPGDRDTQAGRDRDEPYLVLRGEAVLRIGDDRHPVAPGDFWFVPAATEHPFEDHRRELVVFYVLVGA